MKLKKVAALAGCISMVAASLAGCAGSGGETTAAQTAEAATQASEKETTAQAQTAYTFPLETPVEMSMFAIMNGDSPLDENAVFKYVEEQTNVLWEVNSALGADLTEKKNLLLASGEYPDVFYKAGLTDAETEKYGKQGIFIPLNDLIREYAPNLTKLLDERDGWAAITASDGNIYAIPNIGGKNPAITKLWINTKWLDNLGLEEPTNLDEFYEVLKAFKEQDANGNGDPDDEIPLTCTDVCIPELLMPYFGVTYDMATRCAEVDGQYQYIPATDTFKEFVAYVTKLYQEGLLDKNAFTQKHEQQGAIGQSGDVLGCFFDAGAFLTVGRERDDEFKVLTPFEEGVYPMTNGINTGAMAITDKCEDPALAMAWADQFYTDEGSTIAWMGVEGVSYKLNDDGTWEWLTGNGYGDDIAAVRQNATLQGGANHPSGDPSIWNSGMTDEDEIYLYEESQRIIEHGKTYPVLRVAEADSAELATIKADIDSYIVQYIAQVATGELDLESSWEEYLTTLNNMGAERMQEIYAAAYEAGKTLDN